MAPHRSAGAEGTVRVVAPDNEGAYIAAAGSTI